MSSAKQTSGSRDPRFAELFQIRDEVLAPLSPRHRKIVEERPVLDKSRSASK